jgi:hypothetical protein
MARNRKMQSVPLVRMDPSFAETLSCSCCRAGLCNWAAAMCKYHEVAKVVEPKIAALRAAESELKVRLLLQHCQCTSAAAAASMHGLWHTRCSDERTLAYMHNEMRIVSVGS